MSDTERPDQEPQQPLLPAPALPTKGPPSLALVRRQLTDEEFAASPGIGRMLLDHIDRLEREVVELRDFRDRYYTTHEDCAVLKEQSKKPLAQEVLFDVCLTVGSMALGYAPHLLAHTHSHTDGFMAITIGSVLILGAILARVVR